MVSVRRLSQFVSFLVLGRHRSPRSCRHANPLTVSQSAWSKPTRESGTGNRRHAQLCVLGLIACVCLAACDRAIPDLFGSGSGANTDANSQTTDPTSGDAIPDVNPDNAVDPSADDSVADVTTDGEGPSGDPGAPRPAGRATLQVRNESAVRADVTAHFIYGDTVVNVVFLRVVADTVTTVSSSAAVDVIELSGIDERGHALSGATLTFGIDFDRDTPAVYVIQSESVDEAEPDPDPDPDPEELEPPTLTMLEPESDIALTLGETLLARWVDDSAAPGAEVRILLSPVGSTDPTALIPVGGPVGAALDGLNDQLLIVLENIEAGLYEIVGRIDDGTTQVTSVAPGRVEVAVDLQNTAPSLTIESPTELVELRNGDVLAVEWTDEDDDDNAVITFALVPSGPTECSVEQFAISPPLAEDPEGENGDSALLTIDGVLLGLYDLVGRIDDGRLVGTARVEAVVRIVPESQNDAPELTLIGPADDVEVGPGQSFEVRWTDADENDNAQISLLLDPDVEPGALNGNEVVLACGLDEDDDADMLTLAVPSGLDRGDYRIAGVITDGVTELVTWAPGIVYFGIAAPTDPQVALTRPSFDVWVRLGGSVDVQVATEDVPEGGQVRFYVSNEAYGGSARVDVTGLINSAVTELTFPASPGQMPIPNDAWPRQFDLKAELSVGSNILATSVAPGSVWIRQEVEITDVEMILYTCTGLGNPVSGEREFVGVEITWYGGGFQERQPQAAIRFWLSDDGNVPADGRPDDGHRAFHTTLESPNVIRVAQINIAQVIGVRDISDEEVRPTIDLGTYHVITVVEPESFGRIMSPPHPSPVEVCFPPLWDG